jgi:hypothetical protein
MSSQRKLLRIPLIVTAISLDRNVPMQQSATIIHIIDTIQLTSSAFLIVEIFVNQCAL